MQKHVTLTYLIETAGSPEKLAARIASDQSTGTFVPVPGETEELKNRVAARVVAVRTLQPVAVPSFPDAAAGPFNRAEADIAFPLDAIGTDLSALMTIAIGGVYSIMGLTGIRVVDLKLPDAFGVAHAGPQFGVAGSRKLTGVFDRPIIGTIVKPALGLRPDETAALVRDVIDADVDFVKDDEKLMSPAYSPLEERVKAIMPLIHDREQKSGKKVMYAQSRYGNHARRQLCRGQHKFDWLWVLRLPAQAVRACAACASQWLGHSYKASGARDGF
jgi:3-oxoisoapionate-4-phosphate decarboxylase